MASPQPGPGFNRSSLRGSRGINAPFDGAGSTALHISAENGDVISVVKLLRLRADPNQPDKYGRTPLYNAIQAHNFEIVQLLVDNGATFRTEDSTGRTPLMVAVEAKCSTKFLGQMHSLGMFFDFQNRAGRHALHTAAACNNTEIIGYLVQNGVAVNLPDEEEKTALHAATESHAHNALRQLIALGADPLARTKEIKTPLHIAAAAGNETAVDTLLAQASVVQTINDFKTYAEGHTPLMSAVANNRQAVVEKMINAGADLSLRDNQSRDSLYLAAQLGHVDMVQLLIQRGADVEKSSLPDGNKTPILHSVYIGNYTGLLKVLHAAGVDLNAVDIHGRSSLYCAANIGAKDKVKALLDCGADPNLADVFGYRPIDIAVERYYQNETTEVVRLLLEHKADPNLSPVTRMKYSPLHTAVRTSSEKMIRLLLEYKANIDEKDRAAGMTPFLLSAQSGHDDISQMLLDGGADACSKDQQQRGALHLAAAESAVLLGKLLKMSTGVQRIDEPDVQGLTPLHYACGSMQWRQTGCAEILLKAGANPWACDAAGMTPLQHAVSRGDDSFIDAYKKVLGEKANWSTPNSITGETLMHMAARNGMQATIEQLVSLGADINAKAAKGETPLHIAARANRWESIERLLNAGADALAQDNEGKTPQEVALAVGNRGVAALLDIAVHKKKEVVVPRPPYTKPPKP